jgi:hypothetical protein
MHSTQEPGGRPTIILCSLRTEEHDRALQRLQQLLKVNPSRAVRRLGEFKGGFGPHGVSKVRWQRVG